MSEHLIPFQQSWSDISTAIKKEIDSEVTQKTEDYILNVDSDKYINYLIDKYTIHPITIGKEPCNMSELKSEMIYVPNRFDESYSKEIYTIKVDYPFSGDFWLLRIRPMNYQYSLSGTIKMGVEFNDDHTTVSLIVKFYHLEKNEFERELKEIYKDNFNEYNIRNINNHVKDFNLELRSYIQGIFNQQKNKYLKKANFMAAIKISSNKSMPQTFSVPTIRTHLEQPRSNIYRIYNIDPTLHYDTYQQILQVLRGIGRSFETKPNNYIGKNEEEIRDAFLPILETHFESCTSTGETFNALGKTDLLIRHTDGTNLFVGECKFWKGPSHLSDAIYQLFDRYLTWRDTKTALLVFVKQDNITEIIRKINETCKSHKYHVRYDKQSDENSFSYIFHLPADKERLIFLEVLVFHFNKKTKLLYQTK